MAERPAPPGREHLADLDAVPDVRLTEEQFEALLGKVLFLLLLLLLILAIALS